MVLRLLPSANRTDWTVASLALDYIFSAIDKREEKKFRRTALTDYMVFVYILHNIQKATVDSFNFLFSIFSLYYILGWEWTSGGGRWKWLFIRHGGSIQLRRYGRELPFTSLYFYTCWWRRTTLCAPAARGVEAGGFSLSSRPWQTATILSSRQSTHNAQQREWWRGI